MDKEKIAELFARETGFHIDFISADIEGFAQAVRNAALEEAAEECDALRDEDFKGTEFYSRAADLCSTAIRSMKTKEGG